MGKQKILVSACLLGVPCRYDGKSREEAGVLALLRDWVLIPICPEQLGGLPTPRLPAERQGEKVCNRAGEDVSDAYGQGARQALRLAQLYGCRHALLKEKSPSCGSGLIYDGRFKGQLIPGEGVTAQCLRAAGLRVWGESQAAELARLLKEEEA